MEIVKSEANSKRIRFSIIIHGTEVARAFLYLINNNLHSEPYGLVEDVFVEPELRQQGIGSKLIKDIIAEARKQGCYKLIATSRHKKTKVHELYEKFGFQDHGKEFRMNFEKGNL